MGQGASERLGAVVKRRLGRWVIVTDGTRAVATRATEGSGRLMLDSGPRASPGQGSPIAVGACLVDPAIVLRTVVLMLIAYLAGSIPMGVVVARLTGGTDPRTIGS